MGLLGGLRLDRQVLEAVVVALVRDVVARPQGGDRLEHLVHPPAPFLDGDAERGKLLAVPADAHAEDRSAAGELVEGRPLLRERDGVAEREDQHERAEADGPRHAAERGEEGHWLEPGDAVRRRRDEQVVDEHRTLEPAILRVAKV